MLEHQKLLLQQISEDKSLFRKELMKSIMWLPSYEIYQLHTWVKENYWNTHKEIIVDVFELIAA